MEGIIEKRIAELGIEIPEVNKPSGAYIPAVICGNLIFTAGQVPRVNGYVRYQGKVGESITVEEGYEGARICAINCLAAIKNAILDLDKIEHIVKLNGYVNVGPGFSETYKVIDGASQLLLDIFGEKAIHARSAVGVTALPDGAVCEVEMIAQIKS
ncbi:MAG: RidA family protein [Lachnoclostridium edouardi]|uniref:RidA family protein n=1 Tax=Lachnoclostridium edouardi TaxID=1926283 RepID=UPI0026DBBA48|nr:RidA family protein [Lachnoclostridium edouardi]MDO4278823.1 RidA family protein [Lachnoclostridium edouardi]